MPHQTLKILEEAILSNDINTLRSTLQIHNLPIGNHQDYELLIKALRLGRKRITNLLLDKGCHASKPGIRNCTTPLHIAVTKVGWSSIVVKLVARGARVDVCNDNGDTPIHVAFLNNASETVIDLLLKCYTKITFVDVVNKDGLGLLHIACTRPYLDIVKGLVDIGGSNILSQVSLQTSSPYAGWSPLHFAVSHGRHKIAKLLCHYEVDVGVLNGKGSTALHLAVHRRDIKMIDMLLLCSDWNINHVDSSGISHFMAACASSDPDIVRQFLRIATDTSPESLINTITARVKDLGNCPFAGYTPMHFAAEFGRLGTMQLLIDRGVHCTTANKNISPLDLARKRCHETITKLLEKHCSECKECKSFVPELENNTVFVDMSSDKTDEKSAVFNFSSSFGENQVIDECCMLNFIPLPEHTEGEHKGDCELCKLQDIFLIDNSKNQHRENSFNDNETLKISKRNSVICRFRKNLKIREYLSNGQSLMYFMAIMACIYILTCIFFISKYKFADREPTNHN